MFAEYPDSFKLFNNVMKKLLFPFSVFIWIALVAGCGGDSDQDPAPNTSPVASAGSDQKIYMPTDSVELIGSGSDADGSIEKYEWTKVSGPDSYSLTNATAAVTKVKSLVVGVYEFRLKVSDNKGLSDQDNVVVTVLEACPCAPNCDLLGDPCDPFDY